MQEFPIPEYRIQLKNRYQTATMLLDHVDCHGGVAQEIQAVEGKSISLPCDVKPPGHDKVYMVFWFQHGSGYPIYRLQGSVPVSSRRGFFVSQAHGCALTGRTMPENTKTSPGPTLCTPKQPLGSVGERQCKYLFIWGNETFLEECFIARQQAEVKNATCQERHVGGNGGERSENKGRSRIARTVLLLVEYGTKRLCYTITVLHGHNVWGKVKYDYTRTPVNVKLITVEFTRQLFEAVRALPTLRPSSPFYVYCPGAPSAGSGALRAALTRFPMAPLL
ncbi:hypothetical protein GWI33_003197 [Rhynchophorus ferrugineus]|uniref:Uncharacterized protein n=1 Tax=Rhynchophorus ferrugineus TaxID=354439 RepID=A0A834MKW9_RHYFE|nr:hypothetical protein GWI33_003197 [Rhynchophorus ferrugineus]